MALMVKIRGVGLSARIPALQTASGRALFCLLLLFLGASGAIAQERDVKPQDGQSGFGQIEFSGLLQAWYSSGDAGFDDTFRIRRTELKFTGEALRQLNWTVMVDPAKLLSQNPNVNRARGILQDAFITLSFHQRLNLNVGQFKVPLSLEGLQSSAGLDTERALFISDRARGGAYGDVRDIGVMAYGPLTDQLDYKLGFFDGSGDTRDEVRNEQKAVAGRVSYRPTFLPGLQVGTSGLRGNGATIEHARRDRLGADSSTSMVR